MKLLLICLTLLTAEFMYLHYCGNKPATAQPKPQSNIGGNVKLVPMMTPDPQIVAPQ